MNTQSLSISFAPLITSEGDVPKNFAGTAYSGGVIPAYGWFGDVAIDLSSMKVPSKPVFALLNHDTDQRAGRCEVFNAGASIEVSGSFSKATPAGQQVAAEFAEGAPWEFSVGINAEFEPFKKPTVVEVNGQSLKVNGVFRNASVREVSFVPAGADPNTKAVAFEKQPELFNSLTVESDMELKEMEDKVSSLTALNSDLQLQLKSAQDDHDQVVADLNTRLSAEVEQSKVMFDRANELEAKLNQFKADVRMGAVKALFADLNRDASEAAVLPYLSMDEATFAVVSADLRSLKPINLNADLFKEVAVKGKEGATEISLAAQLFNQVAGVK